MAHKGNQLRNARAAVRFLPEGSVDDAGRDQCGWIRSPQAVDRIINFPVGNPAAVTNYHVPGARTLNLESELPGVFSISLANH